MIFNLSQTTVGRKNDHYEIMNRPQEFVLVNQAADIFKKYLYSINVHRKFSIL